MSAGRTSSPFRIGHWTDREARTGCTVVVFPSQTPTVVDVRGGAPGTRETDLLEEGRMVRHADAILLTGGSAFGLAAADGVMRGLREQGRGFPTTAGPVPIVPAAVLFDLAMGKPTWPDADAGLAALHAAVEPERAERGPVGAGTGATVGSMTGHATPGGIGIARRDVPGGSVTAIVAVNAFGVVNGNDVRETMLGRLADVEARQGEHTTIGVILIDAPADFPALRRCVIAGHDALARMIVPAHTIFDGDALFVSGARAGTPSPLDVVALAIATELAVEAAIRDGVTQRRTVSPCTG